MEKNYLIFDNLALGAEAVERSPDGLPTAWRLLKIGENELVQAGRPMRLVLAAEDVEKIVAYAKSKGERIPVDSRHALYLAAEKFKVEEFEVRKLLPHGTAALGFADLAARPDGLWVENVEFIPLAADLVKAGMFKYFSPVLRGLESGNLRVTSVALDNVPALNNLDAIAASAERSEPTKEKSMDKVTAALKKWLKLDALALSAESDGDVAGKIEAKAAEGEKLEALMAAVREVLKLDGDILPEALKGRLQALVDTAEKAPELAAKAEEAALAAEIAKGIEAGKLTNAMLKKPPFNSFDSVAMAAYLEAVPAPVVPLGRAAAVPSEKAIALSAEQGRILDQLGVIGDARKKAEKEIVNG